MRPTSWDLALWETAPVLFLVFCGVWSFLSVAAAVVCCCWLPKFIIRSSSGPGSLLEYFMILRIPEFDLWILSAVETTELLILWGMTLFTNSATKLLQIRSVMELFLLRSTRPGKQRGKIFTSLFSVSMLTGEVFSCFLLAGSHLHSIQLKARGLPHFNEWIWLFQ